MKRGLLSMLVLALSFVGTASVNAQTWTGNTVGAGTFYLYNVGSGLFLTGANDWGTHASLSAAGSDYVLAVDGDGFTLDSKFSNGGDNHFLNGAWSDGSATRWVFAGDKSGYTIKNTGGQYLYATGNGTYVDVSADATGDNAKWILVTREDFLAAMDAATLTNPIDVSSLILCPDLNRNDTRSSAWKVTRSGGNFTLNGPNNDNRKSYGCELWNNTFDFYQDLSGMPEGRYELQVSGYGTNGTTYLYLNDTAVPFTNTTSSSTFRTALDEIAAGQHTGNTTGIVVVSDPTIRIGAKRTAQQGADWTVMDNFRLIFYGFDLASLVESFETALSSAKAISDDMSTAAATGLQTVISDCESVDKSSKDEVKSALSQLNTAIEQATASIATYQQIAADIAAFKKNYADGDASTMDEKYGKGTYETYEEFAADLQAAKVDALGQEDGTDYTDLIVNPGFETGDFTGWITNDGGAAQKEMLVVNKSDGRKFDGTVGEYSINVWSPSTPYPTMSVSQELQNLPAGVYTITANFSSHKDFEIKFMANGVTTNVIGQGNGVNVAGSVTCTLPKPGNLTIMVSQTRPEVGSTSGANDGTFFKVDNFEMTYNTIKDLIFVDAGTEKFEATKKNDGQYTDITATVTGGGDLAGTKDNLKDGIRIVYEGRDVLNENLYTAGYKAEAEITDDAGTTYFVKAAEKDGVIKLAQGLFGPNMTYTVNLKPITYYNFDLFCNEIYEQWEAGKEDNMIPDPNDPTWKWDKTTTPATWTATGTTKILNPAWTLEAVGQTWSSDFWTAQGAGASMKDFDYCDPLPLWSNATEYTFTITTDGSVKQDIQGLVKTNTVTAINAWGEDITSELLNLGGITTGIEKVESASNGAIYNLAGQRVAKTQKGIYVVNGKKVAVK